MARPKGTKYIETPEKMWELFLKFKKEKKANPILIVDWVGGMGKKVVREKERPITMEGFSMWLYESKIIDDVWQYFSNLNGAYSDYLGVCSRIRESIRTEQIEGGMAGIYNPSITQRLNGLVEKSEVKAQVDGQIFKGINLDVSGNDSAEKDSAT